MIAGMLQGAAQTSKGVEGAWEWVRAISDPATRADAAIAVSADAWWSDRAGAEREIAALNLPAEMVTAVHQGWDEQVKTAQREAPRNAQNIVSLYNSARSSGATGINTTSKATIISALMDGVSVADVSSPFNGKRFSIGTMDSTSIADVQPYIRLSGDVLEYIADGGQGSSSAPVATNPNPWVLSIGNIASESIAISYRDAYTRSYGSIEEFRVVAESNGTWKIESRRLA